MNRRGMLGMIFGAGAGAVAGRLPGAIQAKQEEYWTPEKLKEVREFTEAVRDFKELISNKTIRISPQGSLKPLEGVGYDWKRLARQVAEEKAYRQKVKDEIRKIGGMS